MIVHDAHAHPEADRPRRQDRLARTIAAAAIAAVNRHPGDSVRQAGGETLDAWIVRTVAPAMPQDGRSRAALIRAPAVST